MDIIKPARSPKRFLLFLLPSCIVVFSSIFLHKQWPFYTSEPDPCYFYLFNGTNLASGHMEIGHIDHPGTPVQCFAAVIIFIKHLFSHSSAPLYQDVLLNPESYLLTCSMILIVLFIGVNYSTGAYVFRHTGSIGLSMLFQLIPLINIDIIQRVIVLCPESFIIITANFFAAYLFINVPEKNNGDAKVLSTGTVAMFAIFSGFLIATKYSCFPVVILVLFIVKKNKQRLIYLGGTVLSFLLFILPALPKFKSMFQWVWNLFTHDGIYGKGRERVINPSEFVQNIKGILLTDTVFTSIYFLITFAFITAIVSRIQKKETPPFSRTMCGIWVSVSALILAVAKHPEFHYLIFAECCFPFGIIISYKILSGSFSRFIEPYKKYEKSILYITFSLFAVFLVIEKIRYIPLRHPHGADINRYVNNYRNIPLIIAAKNRSEREEVALYLGYMYSGNIQGKYGKFLDSLYPNSYIFWGDTVTVVTHWNKIIPVSELLSNNTRVVLYLKSYEDSAQARLIDRFATWNEKLKQVKLNEQEIFKNPETLQNICILSKSNE